MIINSLNLRILLVLSYITAVLSIGMTINGSYYPAAWFASGSDSIIMNPIESEDKETYGEVYGVQIITLGDHGKTVTDYQGDDLRKLAEMKNSTFIQNQA